MAQGEIGILTTLISFLSTEISHTLSFLLHGLGVWVLISVLKLTHHLVVVLSILI